MDGDAESTLLFYNLHVDRRVGERLNPFVELNGYHYLDEGAGTNAIKLGGGARLPVSSVQAALGLSGFEGMDIVHLGSDNVEGNDVVTLAVGCRFALTERASLGVAYERPLTRRRDILKQRVSFNLMVGF